MKSFILVSVFTAAVLFGLSHSAYSQEDSQTTDPSATTEAEAKTDTAQFCIVSNEKIEGSGVQYNYLGTAAVFCCTNCEKSFKKNPAKFLKSGVKDPVCGMTHVDLDINFVSDEVKYYFCSESCKEKFEANPSEYLIKYSEKENK